MEDPFFHKPMTTSLELAKASRLLNLPLEKIIFKNQIKYINPSQNPYCLIINLDDSNSGRNGTHWTALFVINNKSFYFDSFGVIYPNSITDFLNKMNIKKSNRFFNKKEIQQINEGMCGQFCISFLYHIKKNPTYKGFCKFIEKFRDTIPLTPPF